MHNKMKLNPPGYSLDSYVLAILISFELLMSFTFLGFIHIPPISVTFAYIPVIVAACLLGTPQACIMGIIFGLASMYKSTAFYVTPADMIFSPVMSGKPLSSIFLSVGTRLLFGLLIGLAFYAAKKQKHSGLLIGIISFAAPKFHGIIVYAAMKLLFPEFCGVYLENAGILWSDLIAAVLSIAVTEALWTLYNSSLICSFRKSIERYSKIPYRKDKMKQLILGVFTLFSISMTVFAAFYFSSRTSYMLNCHGLQISPEAGSDLIRLQVQFTVAVLSLNIISIIILNLVYKYNDYQKYLGEIDYLTNVMGRRLFIKRCIEIQKNYKSLPSKYGWFLFLDSDNFKMINDLLGHTTGDTVLKETADALKRNIGEYGIIGRIGGDEFAAMLTEPLSKEDLMQKLDCFLSEISDALPKPYKVSCSIGVCRFTYPTDISSLMGKTDDVLYNAKAKGRACYIIKD